MVRIKRIVVGLAFLTFICACSGMSTREQRILSGGAIGAGAGAGISVLTGGSVAAGSAIGAAAGALGGFLYDESKK
ncbi:MAG: hypothetical protein HY788_19725 [Deltaproteobacteria bacterium]|nr:hypothetical protein [Deltaproteobacteria bacterium]